MPTWLYLPFWKPDSIVIPLPDVGLLPENLQLHPFGMLVAMAVLVGTQVATRRAEREGVHPRVLGEMVGFMFIAAFVFGHMLDAVFYHWDVVRERPLFLFELWNGLSSFGGFVGAFVGGMAWSLYRRMPLLPFADICAYAFPFGWLFGRLGCSVAHDHPGHVTDFFLAVDDYRIAGMSPPYPPRHDLGVYEAMWCVAMIPLFLWLGQKPRKRGFYMAVLPLLYAPVRFGLDFLRATDVPGADPRLYLGLTPGHFGALLLLLTGLAVSYRVFLGPPVLLPPAARLDPEDEEGDEPLRRAGASKPGDEEEE